jgi:GDP-L-fucose synthase
MEYDAKIYIAGHRGLVGSSLLRKLNSLGYTNLVYLSSSILDLRNKKDVDDFFQTVRPDYVFLSAAKVGGIVFNQQNQGSLLYDNLQIQNNVIDAAYRNNTKKFMFMGSVCVYPRECPQPILEEHLMTGPLEPTNEAYALSKIVGLKMARMYSEQYGFNSISIMPANLYGINDNFDPVNSHVIPGMIRKFIDAKNSNADAVTLFGDGSPTREFLYVDDLAEACIKLMNEYDSPDHINIGSGDEWSIKDIADKIVQTVGYKGEILWDTTKPNGAPRRKLNISKILNLGWQPTISLDEGLKRTVEWYESQT